MPQHVYARVSGFGLTVIPFAPFQMIRSDEVDHALDIQHSQQQHRLFARVIPDGDGRYKSQIGQATESLYDVADIAPGPHSTDWVIETSVATCRWPAGYELCSNNFPDDPGPFDLIGPYQELIYTQQPRRMPDVKDMCAPGQTVLDIQHTPASDWIELQHSHEGAMWFQRHEVVKTLQHPMAVTSQCRAEFRTGTTAAARQVAESLTDFEDQ